MRSEPCKYAIVVGTRPELIKVSLISELLGEEASLVHTGQHYDVSLNMSVFQALGLPLPSTQLAVKRKDQGSWFAGCVSDLVDYLKVGKFRAVIVHGDTNSTLAGAISAEILGLPILHVESGLRSFDRRMPEERIRRAVDHLSSNLFPPTPETLFNLEAEGLAERCSPVFGNTVIDAFMKIRELHANFISRRPMSESYVLATFHRPENVDSGIAIEAIVDSIAHVQAPVVLPAHPRLLASLKDRSIAIPRNLKIVSPMDPVEFHRYLTHAALVLSDSGGVIEESTVARVPLVSVRRSSERNEAIPRFAQRVDVDDLAEFLRTHSLEFFQDWSVSLRGLESPYGDGNASQKIVKFIRTLGHL